jgi:peptidoglycan/xylan/chitin deacetylase (PgdA/CDA1 family)
LGVARTVEIDTGQGPRFGSIQAKDREFLKDHEVVLTFDDGPHEKFTRGILDALDAHCTKATFFMVGRRALAQPGIVQEVASRGHSVASHTWSHANLGRLSPAQAQAEIELGVSAVQRALGKPATPFFRFPYLSESRAAVEHLKARNIAMFSIDIDSFDYRTFSSTAVTRNLMGQLAARRKGIILMHDIQPASAGAIRTLLAELKSQGYKVVHLRAAQPQVTIAEYDQRLDTERKIAVLPVSQRGVTSLQWQASVDPPGGPALPSVSGSHGRNWLHGVFSGN